MARISVPTTAQLHPGVRIEARGNLAVLKALNRLSRPSLLSLALEWLRDENQPLTAPYLRPRRTRPRRPPRQEEAEDDADSQDDGDDDGEGDFYPPLSSLAALRDYYADLAGRRGSKREVLDRIVDGDWRGGLTLYQLAMADLQHLHDHPTSMKWAAYKMVPLRLRSGEGGDGEAEVEVEVDRTATAAPKFHPSTFLARLTALMPPDVKAFFNFERHRSLPLLLLRVLIVESPYGTGLAFGGGRKGDRGVALEGARTVYVAFPDAAPFVYVSKTSSAAPGGGGGSGGETKSLAALVLEAVPRALSRPRDRVALRPTHLVTRNLAELLLRRGAGRTNAAGGGWDVYADEKKRESPLDTVLPSPPLSVGERRLGEEGDEDEGAGSEKTGKKKLRTVDEEREERAAKRRKLVAQARFGSSARVGDEKGVERVDITMLDPFPGAAAAMLPPPSDEEEDEAPEDERVRSRGPKPRGRRSTLDLQFRRAAEEEEEDDDDGGTSAGGGGPRTHDDAGWRPRVRLTLHGSHVFAGLRQLVEAGVIDGEKMPGWMTGEEGVTVGAVQHGRIRGHKGSGI